MPLVAAFGFAAGLAVVVVGRPAVAAAADGWAEDAAAGERASAVAAGAEGSADAGSAADGADAGIVDAAAAARAESTLARYATMRMMPTRASNPTTAPRIA